MKEYAPSPNLLERLQENIIDLNNLLDANSLEGFLMEDEMKYVYTALELHKEVVELLE